MAFVPARTGLNMALELQSREISGLCDASGVEACCSWKGSIGSLSSSDESCGASLMVMTPFTSAEALGPGITQPRDAERILKGYETMGLLYRRSN